MRSRAFLALAIVMVSLAACGWSQKPEELLGYMEANLVLVGPEESGRVVGLAVEEGDTVAAGDTLFTLDSKVQEAELAAAEARLRESEAALQLSFLSLERAQELRASGTTAQARLDDAKAAYERDKAAVEASRAAIEQARVKLDRRKVAASEAGRVEDVYFREGEVVNASQPVVALLSPGNLRVRFYLSEPKRASVAVGDRIGVACDGCPDGMTAHVSFIAREAEFTPPVIFSREERSKLVYLVEARPEGETLKLSAGQPITVRLDPPPANEKQ